MLKSHLSRGKKDKDKIQINVYLEKEDRGIREEQNIKVNTNYCSSALAVCGLMAVLYIIQKMINNIIIIRAIHRPVMVVYHEPRNFINLILSI